MIEVKNEQFFNVPETAKKLEISVRTVFNLIKQGKIKATRVGKRRYIKEDWIEEYLKPDNVKSKGKEDDDN